MKLIIIFTLLFLVSVFLPTFNSFPLESKPSYGKDFLQRTGEHGTSSLRNTVQHEEQKAAAANDNTGKFEPNEIHYSLKASSGGGGRGKNGVGGGDMNNRPSSKNGASVMRPIPLAFVVILSLASAHIVTGVAP